MAEREQSPMEAYTGMGDNWLNFKNVSLRRIWPSWEFNWMQREEGIFQTEVTPWAKAEELSGDW